MQVKNFWWVGLFSIAMAYVESAVVVYLPKIYASGSGFLSTGSKQYSTPISFSCCRCRGGDLCLCLFWLPC